MLDTVLGSGDMVGSKSDIALPLKEFTFCWARQAIRKYFKNSIR